MKLFVPFSEDLVEETGVVGRLVPFQLEYQCVRLHGRESVDLLPGSVLASDSQPGTQTAPLELQR
jgi:hypothetical protein